MADTKNKAPRVKVPRHVGVIMDGNRRWAKKKLMPAFAGHNAGVNRMIALARKARELGVEYLTVYALSTENLSRPEEELKKMYSLLEDKFASCVEELVAEGAAVKVIGNLSLLPQNVQRTITQAVATSPQRADFTFIMAIAYGARAEITAAANAAVQGGNTVDEEQFGKLLSTSGVPDPDFIIRTGGELRLSNFLLWQAAYAELYFTPTLFPDFSDEKFEEAIADYAERVRRFGKL